jgi:hypothetical protein
MERSAIRRTRGEAVPAVHRLIAARIEWNLGYSAALAARSGEHLARTSRPAFATAAVTTAGVRHLLAGLTAIGAPIRLVLETFLLVKPLFAGAKNELASTVDTVEHFIYVHGTR